MGITAKYRTTNAKTEERGIRIRKTNIPEGMITILPFPDSGLNRARAITGPAAELAITARK